MLNTTPLPDTVYVYIRTHVCLFLCILNCPTFSYDAHIHLNGYPFLDSKGEFAHNTVASDVMNPRKGSAPLTVVDLSECTIGSLKELVLETEFFGFPCVLSKESQMLAGFITRKDIQTILRKCYMLQGNIFLF